MDGRHQALRRQVVLDGLDLAVAPGRSLALLGRSGQGKSVTIKLALGLMKPDAGRCCWMAWT
jgi:phospholipid/cholesterol/gamma-HCH transport system ATP-binding protein